MFALSRGLGGFGFTRQVLSSTLSSHGDLFLSSDDGTASSEPAFMRSTETAMPGLFPEISMTPDGANGSDSAPAH